MSLTVDTPCIGICSTIYGDTVCRGCKRHYREVIDWNIYTAEQKHVIMQRLSHNINAQMQEFFELVDELALTQQLNKFGVRYHTEEPALCWFYHLLREGHSKIHDLSKYGVKRSNHLPDLSLTDVYHRIDEQLLSDEEGKNG